MRIVQNGWQLQWQQLQWQQHPDQGYLETCDTCVRLCNMNTMNTHVSSGPVCEGFHIGLHCSSFNVIDICHILGNHQKPQNSAGSMALALIIASYGTEWYRYVFSGLVATWLIAAVPPKHFWPTALFPKWFLICFDHHCGLSCNTTFSSKTRPGYPLVN
jgi:hypothetical protein